SGRRILTFKYWLLSAKGASLGYCLIYKANTMIRKIFKSRRGQEKNGLVPGVPAAEYIHYDVLLKMISKFRGSYMQPNSRIPDKSLPVRWAWISLEDVKTLVAGNKIDWNDDAAIKNVGIRMYFGVHGEEND